jgi:ABC-type dipeptide transport system, periplasmic component
MSVACWSPIRTGGASAATSTRRLTSSSSPTLHAWLRSFPARSISSSIRLSRTCPRLQKEARFKLAQVSDIGTQYLGFDQSRDELQFGDVKGRNPFKDLRVRRAVYAAIDIDAIVAKVLRGQATASGSYVSRLLDGYVPDLESRPKYDPAAARALLKEAGYPDGFQVTLDCVNVAYRAAVCQAITGMLAQVGIRTTFQPWPTATFFPKLTQATTSFFEFGWSPQTDPWPMLNAIVHSYGADGPGTFNGGRYSNPRLDQLIDRSASSPISCAAASWSATRFG